MKEFDKFDEAMKTILRADPKAVRAEMEEDKRQREKQRKTKKSSGTRASNASGQKVVSPTLPVTSA
jgi:hypothetical protein